jgi:hypothetical protein
VGKARALYASARVYLDSSLQHICTQEVHFETAGRLALGRDALPSAWGIDYRGEG